MVQEKNISRYLIKIGLMEYSKINKVALGFLVTTRYFKQQRLTDLLVVKQIRKQLKQKSRLSY